MLLIYLLLLNNLSADTYHTLNNITFNNNLVEINITQSNYQNNFDNTLLHRWYTFDENNYHKWQINGNTNTFNFKCKTSTTNEQISHKLFIYINQLEMIDSMIEINVSTEEEFNSKTSSEKAMYYINNGLDIKVNNESILADIIENTEYSPIYSGQYRDNDYDYVYDYDYEIRFYLDTIHLSSSYLISTNQENENNITISGFKVKVDSNGDNRVEIYNELIPEPQPEPESEPESEPL